MHMLRTVRSQALPALVPAVPADAPLAGETDLPALLPLAVGTSYGVAGALMMISSLFAEMLFALVAKLVV
jgi:hypothetical protein